MTCLLGCTLQMEYASLTEAGLGYQTVVSAHCGINMQALTCCSRAQKELSEMQ